MRFSIVDPQISDFAGQLEEARTKERSRRRRKICLAVLAYAALAANLALLVRQVAHEFQPAACRPYIPPAEIAPIGDVVPQPKGVLT